MEHARVLVGSEQIFKGPQHAHALINTRLGRLQCHFVARDKGLSRAFAARAKRDNAPSALPYVAQYRCANTGASSLGDSIFHPEQESTAGFLWAGAHANHYTMLLRGAARKLRSREKCN